METGTSFSSSSPARSSAHFLGTKARSEMVSSTPREGSALVLSSSEEGDDSCANQDESVDLPPQSVLFEELLEVVTRAVAKLNIDWPAKKDQKGRPESKLDECFLCPKSLPPCIFSPICILRCLDHGINHTWPASSVKMFLIIQT